jgi:membrane-associated phospholipid phosphatase
LKLKYDHLLSSFAFNFNLRRCTLDLETTRLFAGVDEAAHHAVLAATTEAYRHDVAARFSNIIPLLGFGALVASSALLLSASTSTASGDREREIRRRVGVAWSANLSVVAIVGVLKEVFARERPSGLTSFAFPSGHTACASLLTGLALFVLLDPVWEVMNSPGAGENAQDDDSDTGAEAGKTVAARGVERVAGAGAPVGRDARLALWAAATAVTAAGRIVADRHWVTDTMAGAAIGIVFVSGSVAVLRLWQHEHEELDDTSI